MWQLLWHLRGSKLLPASASDSAVLDRLELMLIGQRKTITYKNEKGLAFDDSHLKAGPEGPNWLAMVIYDRGNFHIEQHDKDRSLKYNLRSLHAFIFCLVAAAIFFCFGLIGGELTVATKYALLAFSWLYGGNLVLAWILVPRKIQRVVEGA
jgi:hypothetical protein